MGHVMNIMDAKRAGVFRLSAKRVLIIAALLSLIAAPFVIKRAVHRIARHLPDRAQPYVDKLLPPGPEGTDNDVQAALPPGACTRTREAYSIVEPIYDKGLAPGWQDYGWATRELKGPGPARLKFSKWAGWIVSHRAGKLQDEAFGALVFKVKAPESFGDFLEVRLDGEAGTYEPVQVRPEHRLQLVDGWIEVLIPTRQLNPYGGEFQRVRVRATKTVSDDWVYLDAFGFIGPRKEDAPKVSYPERPAAMTVRCDASSHPISPMIYGLASDSAPEDLRAGAYRLGGNRMSRYNWQIGACNTGSDWFFRNVPHHETHMDFINRTRARKAYAALTVPLLGWVAKDKSSYSFPVSVHGPQKQAAPENSDIGNGVTPAGKEIRLGDTSRTSVEGSPDMIRRWVESIRAEEAKAGQKLIHEYILDNEPALWNSTHRDVHPEPLTYDELLDRTIRYGTAVRTAAPDAIISGPAEWGWSNYFWSAKDAAEGFSKKPDRRAHGDIPLLDWYLQKLQEHEKKTGVRILDVVDLHFYPQSKGIFANGGGGSTDNETNARRLRATRALWDPEYMDESWIKEKIRLIPRVKEIIAKNYPGRGFSIGEWNFGAEGHMSGGLALAEALGRFAEHGLRSAFYWTTPKPKTPAYWGFRAFRNYDGAGGRFLDEFISSVAPEGTSLFVSRDKANSRIVAIALNLQPTTAAKASLDMGSCGAVASYTVYTYAGRPPNFVSAGRQAVQPGAKGPSALLAPYSIAVFDIQLQPGSGGK